MLRDGTARLAALAFTLTASLYGCLKVLPDRPVPQSHPVQSRREPL